MEIKVLMIMGLSPGNGLLMKASRIKQREECPQILFSNYQKYDTGIPPMMLLFGMEEINSLGITHFAEL